MIVSATCTGLSEVMGYTHVSLEGEDGSSIKIMLAKGAPCPYQFKQEYMIEINPVVRPAIRQIK